MIATRSMRLSLAFVACAILAGCHPPPPQANAPTPPPELILHGVTVHTFRGSEPVGVGTADQLTYERTSGDSVATKARMHVLATGSSPRRSSYRIDADTVQGNALERVADATGHVTLHGDRGMVGTTAAAHFDGVRNIAEGQSPVTLKGPGYGTRANGFTAHLDRDELSFDGNVTSWFGGKL